MHTNTRQPKRIYVLSQNNIPFQRFFFMSLVKKTNVNLKNKLDPELVKIYSIINIQTFLSL
jgi:hypothetical protein